MSAFIDLKQLLPGDLETSNLQHRSKLFGQNITQSFAKQVGLHLETNRLERLQQFLLQLPCTPDPKLQKALQTSLNARLEQFYAAEVQESGQEKSRLAGPSGPAHAELGIILHCQTKDGEVGPFWDEENPSIQLLVKKGLSSQFAFITIGIGGAEENCRGRGLCPATKWSKSVKKLHDELSSDLLSLLDLRFIIIGGTCAGLHYKKIAIPGRRTILLPLVPGLELELDLEFAGHSLERIVAYVEHLSATYFTSATGSTGQSLKFDAASSFFLWLLARPHNPIAIRNLALDKAFRFSKSAPLGDMWRYLRIERAASSVLKYDELDASFLSWPKQFLGNEFVMTVQKQGSIVEACVSQMNQKVQFGKEQAYIKRSAISNPIQIPASLGLHSHKLRFA
jgi:hypothetical protein